MAHYLRTLMTALTVVVLATAGVIPGEVLCIMPGGEARLEAVGECEEYSSSADADGIRPSPACVDIPLESVAAPRPESVERLALPTLVVRDFASFLAPVFSSHVPLPAFGHLPSPPKAQTTRTIVLLI